jgi:hypothetical protein
MKKLYSLVLSALALFALALPVHAQVTYRTDSIASLVAITIYGSDAKAVAFVGGSASRDDGLGGLFFYDGTSTTATNVYAVFKPTNSSGRWFKLPTAVAWQNEAVTAAVDTTYAWKLLRGTAQTNFFGIGADNNIAYLQTFNGKNLHINSIGNDVVFQSGGSGSVLLSGASTTLGASGTAIKAVYSAVANLDYPSISANSVTNLTITVAGAGTNSTVSASAANGTGITAGVILGQAWVSATNTVTVTAANTTVGAIDPAAAAVRVTVTQF